MILGPISQHSITAKWDDGRVITVDHPEKEIDHIIQPVQTERLSFSYIIFAHLFSHLLGGSSF